jgi:hypothetical protein
MRTLKVLSIFDSDGELVPVAASFEMPVIMGIKDKLKPRRFNVATLTTFDSVPETLDVRIEYPQVGIPERHSH